METPLSVMTVIDTLAVIVFAVSGALVASRKGLDILGFVWLAVLTGIGGGTLRDLILDAPVFWLNNPLPLAACLVAGASVHFLAPMVESRYRWLLWFDALGLALFSIAGAAKGLEFGVSPLVAIVMGVITGTVGGIIRDVVGNEPSVILRREIYVTASASGACCYVLLIFFSITPTTAAAAGFAVTFAIRGLAIARNLRLPVWRRNRVASKTGIDDN